MKMLKILETTDLLSLYDSSFTRYKNYTWVELDDDDIIRAIDVSYVKICEYAELCRESYLDEFNSDDEDEPFTVDDYNEWVADHLHDSYHDVRKED